MVLLQPVDAPRCVIASGGSIETALLPGRVLALRADYDLDVGCALSRGALDFVTRTAIHGVSGRAPYVDRRQFDAGAPVHLAWRDAAVCVLHPATARILAEVAAGSVTCVVTRLAAFTPPDRLVIAPAIHPDLDPRPYRAHVDALRARGIEVIGGDDLHASWDDVERHLVARLALVRRTPTAVIRLDELLARRR